MKKLTYILPLLVILPLLASCSDDDGDMSQLKSSLIDGYFYRTISVNGKSYGDTLLFQKNNTVVWATTSYGSFSPGQLTGSSKHYRREASWREKDGNISISWDDLPDISEQRLPPASMLFVQTADEAISFVDETGENRVYKRGMIDTTFDKEVVDHAFYLRKRVQDQSGYIICMDSMTLYKDGTADWFLKMKRADTNELVDEYSATGSYCLNIACTSAYINWNYKNDRKPLWNGSSALFPLYEIENLRVEPNEHGIMLLRFKEQYPYGLSYYFRY